MGYVFLIDVVEQIEILNGDRIAMDAELQVDEAVFGFMQLDVCVCEEINDLLSNRSEVIARLLLQKAHQHGRPFADGLPFLGLVQFSDVIVSVFEGLQYALRLACKRNLEIG